MRAPGPPARRRHLMSRLQTGLRGEATMMVTPERTAEAVGSGQVGVFATPQLIALLEIAAVDALRDHLESGETSVGTHLEVSHLAATPVGMKVRAEAVLERAEGRTLTFSVAAWDEREKIGEGRHVRMVVSRERFLARVEGKKVFQSR